MRKHQRVGGMDWEQGVLGPGARQGLGRVRSRLLGQPGNDGDSLTMGMGVLPVTPPVARAWPCPSSLILAQSHQGFNHKGDFELQDVGAGSRSPFGLWVFSTARSKVNVTVWRGALDDEIPLLPG